MSASARIVSELTQTGSSRPIRMLHDRILVDLDCEQGERRSSGGIVIPATAQMGKRLQDGQTGLYL